MPLGFVWGLIPHRMRNLRAQGAEVDCPSASSQHQHIILIMLIMIVTIITLVTIITIITVIGNTVMKQNNVCF